MFPGPEDSLSAFVVVLSRGANHLSQYGFAPAQVGSRSTPVTDRPGFNHYSA